MTIYGLDVSHYQAPGVNLDGDNLKAQGYRFVMAKATEGATYRDPAYHEYRAQAQAEGMMFAAYHFLKHGNIAGQVERFCSFVSDPSIPIMLDVEAYGATLADAHEFRVLAEKRGRRVTLLYLPHWYWERIGKPSLKGWTVVSSAYPSSAHQIGSALYPGKDGSGWAAYGGVKPTIWQFASSGRVDGYSGRVDLDAFEGTEAELRRLFKDYGPKPTKTEPTKHTKEAKVTHHKHRSRGKNIDGALRGLHDSRAYLAKAIGTGARGQKLKAARAAARKYRRALLKIGYVD